ncbi:MAG: hypothetical protein PHV32_10870 [Eubacteriales bacterium]|jgi:hypothetical protein|nr:hypothetical protein [Eubacteriales bacterium]
MSVSVKPITPKPKIEEIAPDYLDGDVLDNLLDFVAWMRANKMTPTFANKSKEGIDYTSHVCYVKLFHGKWAIWISGKHRKHKSGFIDDFLACEELKDVVGASLARCGDCGHGCPPYTVKVCGTKYDNVCACCTVRFNNPSTETLKIVKRVIENRNNTKKECVK